MKFINQIEPFLGKEERRQLNEVMESGWYTEAKKTRTFEKMFSNFVGAKYACAVTSGTTALYVGLKALGIKSGDEVLVPDLTFVATPNAVEMTGAKPILVDIEKTTLNLDIKKISKKITKKTRAIILVTFNGRTTDLKELKSYATKNNLFVIEDAAHSIGSYFNGKHSGNFSDVTAFSFSIPKIITTGQGGMIITNQKKLYNRCLEIKDFGRSDESKKKNIFSHATIGYNFKFTEFQAAIGIGQMMRLERNIRKKKSIYKKYKDMLSNIDEIEFLNTDLKFQTVWSVDILLKSKTQKYNLYNYLKKKLIQTRLFFPPIHRLPPYRKSDIGFENTCDVSERGLFLPSSVTLTDKQIYFISNEILNYFKNTDSNSKKDTVMRSTHI